MFLKLVFVSVLFNWIVSACAVYCDTLNLYILHILLIR